MTITEHKPSQSEEVHDVLAEPPQDVSMGEESDATELHAVQSQISALAQRLTHASHTFADSLALFNPGEGSYLDPHGDKFDALAWAKALMRVFESEGGHYARRSGVAFRNLNVYGSGSGASYLKTISNAPLSIISSVLGRLGSSSRNQPVEILRNLNGVVEDGEMLLVLGPPGSGCSTFLKSLSGETDGLSVSQDTYMNFRGLLAPNQRL